MENKKILDKLALYPSISTFLKFREGIKTGASSIFLVEKKEIKTWEIENEALRPLIRSKDITPFKYKWSENWIIYTLQPNFVKKFPHAIEYLKNHKTILKRRSAVWIFDKEWWELEEPLKEQVFHKPKIVSPLISRRNSFTLEDNSYFYLDNCIFAILRPEKEIRKSNIFQNDTYNSKKKLAKNKINQLLKDNKLLYYLLGILNSQVVEWFLKHKIKRTSYRKGIQGKFYWFRPKYVNQVPIPFTSKVTREKIISLVKNILKSKKKPKKHTRREIKKYVTNLNEVIFDVFKLKEEEKAHIQVFLKKI